MWYVIQVYTGTEEEICGQCRRRVMEDDENIFVILAERMTKIQGQWTLITSWLFSGYVFVETERIDDFCMRLKRIDAMAKLLYTREDMTPIHPEEERYFRLLGGAWK